MVKFLTLRYYNCVFHNHTLRRANHTQTDLTMLHTRYHFTTLSSNSIIGHPFEGINLLQVRKKCLYAYITTWNLEFSMRKPEIC